MKKPLSIFLSILFLFYCFPVSAVAGNSEAQFNNAVSLLRENKFTEASEAFAELGNYPEAPRYAMYCKALAMAEKHQYSTAIKNLKHLTGFLDSDLLVIYFEGLWNENFEDYEGAAKILREISLYRDVDARLASYPGLISAREYRKADALEQQGRLEEALSAFEKLGDYSDSRERAAAIPYKILIRDYKRVNALESIVIPSDDGGTEMTFNPDGTYRFWFAAYSIEDLGAWTFENGVLTLTDVKGKTSSGEGDPIKLHYTYSGSDQLTGDYTIPAITLSALAAEAADRAKVMTHAEYMAAEMDSEVVIESYVQAHQSWWDDKVTVYLQSEDGAYFAYEMACSEEDAAKLVPGAKIRVKGYKTEWAGEVEIASGSTFVFVAGEPWIATAADVTDLLATPELADHMNEFVAVKGATVVAQDNGEAFSYKNPEEKTDDLYFAVEVDGAKYNFCVEYYLCGKDTDVYKAVEGLKVGDVVDIEGFLYWYNGPNLQATSVDVR